MWSANLYTSSCINPAMLNRRLGPIDFAWSALLALTGACKVHYNLRTSSWRHNSSGCLAHRCLCLKAQHYYLCFYIAFSASLSTPSVERWTRNLISPRVHRRIRVFVTSAHFHELSLPLGYCSKPFDPQHLRSMAVFSDTAKRLWGLCLMLTLLVAPDLEYSPLELGGTGCSSNSI